MSKHLGSLAVGAFVIAICQTLRLGMKLLDSMTQEAQDKNFMLKVSVMVVVVVVVVVVKS